MRLLTRWCEWRKTVALVEAGSGRTPPPVCLTVESHVEISAVAVIVIDTMGPLYARTTVQAGVGETSVHVTFTSITCVTSHNNYMSPSHLSPVWCHTTTTRHPHICHLCDVTQQLILHRQAQTCTPSFITQYYQLKMITIFNCECTTWKEGPNLSLQTLYCVVVITTICNYFPILICSHHRLVPQTTFAMVTGNLCLSSFQFLPWPVNEGWGCTEWSVMGTKRPVNPPYIIQNRLMSHVTMCHKTWLSSSDNY